MKTLKSNSNKIAIVDTRIGLALAKLAKEKKCDAISKGYILTKLNGTTIKEIMDDVFFETAEIACEKGLELALNMIK